MENTRAAKLPRRPAAGPAPTRRSPSGPPLSRSRAALLETLRSQPEPTTLAALSRATGLHENTLREHLVALERARLVRRERAAPQGRGRPAWLYRASEEAGPVPSEYAGLAIALASTIQHTSASPTETALAAGSDWGRRLAADRGAAPPTTGAGARRQVVALLDEIGFGPVSDQRHATVRLTRCPLLEAAHRYPEVVCNVHLGLVRGALEEYGSDPTGTQLLPFSEPGACLLHLTERSTGGRR